MLIKVMEKLVDIVHYLHLEIHAAFGSSGNAQTSKMSMHLNYFFSKRNKIYTVCDVHNPFL